MKIIYIHQYFLADNDSGGTRSYGFARSLVERGHQVTMISASSDSILSRSTGSDEFIDITIDGIHLLQSNIPYSTKQSIKERILNFSRFARFAYKMAKAEKDVDLVFATSTPLTVAIPGGLAAKHHHVPFVFEVRDLWPELPKALGVRNPAILWLMKRLELWAYRRADRIVALAPGIKEGIQNTGYPEDRIEFIPNSADTGIFHPGKDQNLTNDINLIFTGAHGFANGLDAVIDAAYELEKRKEEGIHFIFIGNGSEKTRLMERSEDLRLKNVQFLDPIPKLELAELLRTMDVGMMILKNIPAFYNGTSPNKFFDYLAAGLPVLNNYPGWLKVIIEQEKCGIAVSPDNPQAFADAVIQLRDHPEERIAMGRRARELAEREFSRTKSAEEFIAVLETVQKEWNR